MINKLSEIRSMMKQIMATIFVSAISAVSLAALAESNTSDDNLLQAKQLTIPHIVDVI